MASLPREPEAFAEQVTQMIRRMRPDAVVELIGPGEVLIDGRRLDLENLRRMVAQSESDGTQVVEQFLDSLFLNEEETLASLPAPLAQRMVMPRIHHASIFGSLEETQVAHVPFVNETVVLFVLDLPHVTVSVTTEQMVHWRVSAEELDALARSNLRQASTDLTVQIVETEEGGRAAVLSHQDGYDASRLLLADLHRTLAPELGGDFLVATPARDTFVAVTPVPEPFVQRVHSKVVKDYRRLPYPITEQWFYVTRDGVAGGAAA